jgi:hypothetical protein
LLVERELPRGAIANIRAARARDVGLAPTWTPCRCFVRHERGGVAQLEQAMFLELPLLESEKMILEVHAR